MELIQIYAPDKKRLAEYVIQAKGAERTMAQFAEDAGISAPTLSRIINERIKSPLTWRLLSKIHIAKCDAAKFSFEDLLKANGMEKAEVIESNKPYISQLTSNQEYLCEYDRQIRNIITNAVLDRGVMIQNLSPEMDRKSMQPLCRLRIRHDFGLYVPNEINQFWHFFLMGGRNRYPVQSKLTTTLALQIFVIDAWEPEFFENKRVSFVFSDSMMYEQFLSLYRGAPINSAISAILVDLETESVEETWLSENHKVPSILAKEKLDFNSDDMQVNGYELEL